MATTCRLTFLYPHLFRTGGRWAEPTASHIQFVRKSRPKSKTSSPQASCQHASVPFSTSAARRQSVFPQRHGKAVEPVPLGPLSHPLPVEPKEPPRTDGAKEQKKEAEVPSHEAQTPTEATTPSPTETPQTPDDATQSGAEMPELEAQTSASQSQVITGGAGGGGVGGSSGAGSSGSGSGGDGKGKNDGEGPMQTILHMGPPEEAKHKPPYLTPPPYVHHFDSYSLVKQLSNGGYTLDQSITTMKAVRALLSANLDVAQDRLVSKSDVENEQYLFRAACSELSTEIKNNRRIADEHLRQQRTQLQHEVDILSQRLNQELLTLNDTVRGMFNDRRMAVREEQKALESSIQQINYKISVELNSDARSDIEALRWVLIRRSVLGIIFMAFLTLGTLRYASYVSHERQKEAERQKREKEQARKNDGKRDRSSAPDAAEILAAN